MAIDISSNDFLSKSHRENLDDVFSTNTALRISIASSLSASIKLLYENSAISLFATLRELGISLPVNAKSMVNLIANGL